MRTPSLRPKRPILKRREQLLVVEDDPDSLELMGAVLREAGYSVDLARDGHEALARAARRRPDVLVSDLCLPGPNGLQIIARMHAEDPDLPVILTTGLENTKDILTSAESYGATACLKKPMNVDDLMWEIERALAISRQRGRRPGMPLVHLARRPAPPHAI